ncbi:MAG: DNA repair protein RecN [Chloroflexota bacterium]
MALIELSVENLAVVESVRLPLGRGFTVVTGETGAGKSLVVDAVALALGARASADQVRSGTDGARIEAVFDEVPRDPIDPLDELIDEGMLIVRREVSRDGRSLARANDRTVTVASLAGMGARLGEIHGQHEQQRLLLPERQLALLDRFANLDVDHVSELHRAWRASVAAAAELLTDAHELARRFELLRHQADEIDVAALSPGEDLELESRLRAAQHAEGIAVAAAQAVAALRDEGGAADGLNASVAALESAAAHDDRFAELGDRARSLAAEASELARDAATAGERVELDPASQAAAAERLGLVRDLERKYGESVEAVIAFGQSARAELERLENQETDRERLRAEEAARRAALERAAEALTAGRAEAAGELARRVNEELPPLGLPGNAFGAELADGEIGPSGADRVTFSFAPNPGEPPRPLARIASGGEASRLSLALKVVLAAADETPLLVFDEIDSGVGGRNAAALGERLRDLARYHQVLCVTHMPQIAAYADAHVLVGKRVEAGRTFTLARQLSEPERATELAAMLAGEGAGEEAQAAAQALLRSAAGG